MPFFLIGSIMQRDIRSYIPKKKPAEVVRSTKINKRPVISSSDDEESNNSMLIVKKNIKKSSIEKDKSHISSELDDGNAHHHVKSKKKSQSPGNKSEKKLKPVTPDSIFGKTPIKRINALPITKRLQKKEALVHDDDDFEATLNQLDIANIDAIYSKSLNNTQTTKSGKRKNNLCDKDTPLKKIKLNDDTKDIIENKNEINGDTLQGITDNKSKKLNSNSKIDVNKSHVKKEKLNISFDKSEKKIKSNNDDDVDLIEEHIAKKKQHIVKYQAYLQRGGAKNPGSKSIPEGAKNCLAGLSFVVTGILNSLERHEADELIERYGGRVVKTLSKKSDYLVVGDDAGESKLDKARSYKTKQISEDELLELIRTRPAGKASDIIHSRSKKKESLSSPNDKSSDKIESKITKSPKRDSDKLSMTVKSTTDEKKIETPPKLNTNVKSLDMNKIDTDVRKIDSTRVAYIGQAEALVEKYRPKSMKQIIGQHGDKSVAKKFYTWLQSWHKNHNSNAKQTRPSPWAKNDSGSFFKACLLSGPPGIGKTTTAQVVCNELNFDLLEFNASDTRSKRLLKDEISGLLSNTTVKGYFSNNSETKTSAKHVLLMDEVDGMAGNEDRGGLQELITLIKSTEIPIVCICNDRNNAKMRTLANYTFDLRFQKPRIEQIRGAMKSLCHKENIIIDTKNLDRLIQSTNQDIRQVINHLAMLVNNQTDNNDNDKSNNRVNKDLKLGPWDVVRKVFSAEEHKTMSIHDKSDLFFHDYNIAGLFVQENYLNVVPKCSKDELLERVADSAESLALGDLVENSIRGNGSWSMLPIQACYSSVIPGTLMSGYIGGQINFPAWLGRNSKRGKFDRLLQEITVHTRLVTGASKEAINIDYLKPLRDAVTRPLINDGSEGVEAALSTMNHYHLLRDDLDALVEVSLWPNQRDPLQSIESKVKAAFTRAYNKYAAPTPFSVSSTMKRKGMMEPQDSGFSDEIEDDGEHSENDDTLDSDRMVKAKKSASIKTVASTSKDKQPTSRGDSDKSKAKRGRGRGRGK